MIYVFVDPSGSYNEGKGHTGISVIEDFNWDTLKTYSIAAKDFNERGIYWNEIIKTVTKQKPNLVVIESFVIRNNGFLVGKMPETSLFIGAFIWELEQIGIKYKFQTPAQAKARFKDENLGRYIPNYEVKQTDRATYFYLNGKMLNDHIRDSLKHLLFYKKYGVKE